MSMIDIIHVYIYIMVQYFYFLFAGKMGFFLINNKIYFYVGKLGIGDMVAKEVGRNRRKPIGC